MLVSTTNVPNLELVKSYCKSVLFSVAEYENNNSLFGCYVNVFHSCKMSYSFQKYVKHLRW